MERILKVNELNTFIKYRLENDDDLVNITVTGEISNITYNRSGHVYFSLKDDESSISCIMWRSNAEKMKAINGHDGMKINATGKINYYVPYGKVNFEVHSVSIEGIGELQVIYDKRYKELEAKGWFDQSLKKPLPRYPQNIGIVTADTGAAVHDLITTITRRWPIANIFLFPAQVQGEGSSETMAKAIVQANNFDKKIDVLVVGRGGGSYEDLWEFNEMPVLEAIGNSAIPVISAVGHEPDITLADYVADKRAATPTAAGEIATPSIDEIKQSLKHQYESLRTGIVNLYNSDANEFINAHKSLINRMNSITDMNTKSVDSSNQHVIETINRLVTTNQKQIKDNFEKLSWFMNNMIKTNETRFDNANDGLNNRINNIVDTNTRQLALDSQRLNELIQRLVNNQESSINNAYKMINWNIDKLTDKSENNLNNAIKMLNIMNPERPLEQGYALLKKNDKYLSNNDLINSGDELEIVRKEQTITADVKSVNKGDE